MKNTPMEEQGNLNSNIALENSPSYIEEFKNELKESSNSHLQLTQKSLNYLCTELDPYDCSNLSQEQESVLKKFHLKDHLSDPFKFTNIVLKMLHLVEEETNKRLH